MFQLKWYLAYSEADKVHHPVQEASLAGTVTQARGPGVCAGASETSNPGFSGLASEISKDKSSLLFCHCVDILFMHLIHRLKREQPVTYTLEFYFGANDE